MRYLFYMLVVTVFVFGCATPPVTPSDPMGSLLEPGEQVGLRVPARLLHGHDMEEPPYDPVEGYKPIPTYDGELAVTDRRLLFVKLPQDSPPSWVSIPFDAIARARPSRTPLLNYIVVWDRENHPDSFVVDARHVRALHQQFGQAFVRRTQGGHPGAKHSITKE